MENVITQWMNNLLRLLGLTPEEANSLDQWVIFGLIIGTALLIDYTCRLILLKVVKKIVTKTKATWDDIVFDEKVMTKLCHIVAPVLIYFFFPIAFPKSSELYTLILKTTEIYIIAVTMRFIVTFCTAIYIAYNENEKYHDRPLKGLLQTAQVIVFFIGGILIISVLFDKSPASLLAGLGASAAILILVFKDSIMGFISGIQLSANNMLRPGDWITMPKYNADGIVLEVTLNTVKVRNWDNTITTLPPYALVSDSFQNWRGMHESGGRRVKRSINIDMNSVRFCTLEVLERFRKISLIKEYIEETEEELKAYNQECGVDDSVLVNGRRQTNLGVFRAYLERYLRNLSSVNQDMTLMVRHLQPTEKGIPLELYFFTYSKESAVYEQIQADVMDHVLAVVSEFDLAVFQSPTGADFRSLKN
ncbi:mechanosensitive ion channel domain-containing protein [uncultured Bacteroides sp.]|uniref:mechanosensitive ion channel family protein n=1 Tax=uncultured Bacteroides sp. TaxID=162156 RepID=UPI002AAB322F|nr:mechanosensitive ion channel domain-containing protein [uncultured Bacteroides sp.]